MNSPFTSILRMAWLALLLPLGQVFGQATYNLSPLSTAKTGMAGTIIPDDVYLFGGRDASGTHLNTTEKAFYPSGSWFALAPMPTPRSFATATRLPNGRILVVGGQNSIGHLSTVEEYDPNTNTWVSRPSMNTPRSRAKAITISGMVHVFGGYNGISALSTHEIYNPTTMIWTTANPMPMALMDFNGSKMAYGGAESAHIMGGRTVFGNHASIVSNHWEYLPTTDTYVAKANMPQGLANFGTGGEDLILQAVYAYGGYTTSGAPTNAIYRYSRINNTWTTLTTTLSMPIAEFFGDGFWDRTTICAFNLVAIGGVNALGQLQAGGTGYYVQSGPFAAQGMELSTSANANGISLDWKIENGDAIDHFTLMHEYEDGQREILANDIDGTEGAAWSYLHQQAAKGKHHYFVLAHLANGSTRYTAESEIVVAEGLPDIVLYPVPTSGLLKISLPGAQAGLQLQILDAQGKILLEELIPGQSMHVLDLSGLAKGMYFARIQIDGEQVSKRFFLD